MCGAITSVRTTKRRARRRFTISVSCRRAQDQRKRISTAFFAQSPYQTLYILDQRAVPSLPVSLTPAHFPTPYWRAAIGQPKDGGDRTGRGGRFPTGSWSKSKRGREKGGSLMTWGGIDSMHGTYEVYIYSSIKLPVLC